MLEPTIESKDAAHVIRFDGDIAGHDDHALRALFVDLVGTGRTRVVADMTKVSFVDSVVLGTLVWGMKNLREADGDLRLFGVHAFVKRLFDVTQLDRAFQTFETEEEALGSFA